MNKAVVLTESLPNEIAVCAPDGGGSNPPISRESHVSLPDKDLCLSVGSASGPVGDQSSEVIGSTEERSFRPWGYYQVLHRGERFQVKCLSVNPGCQLSLQKHFHRAEHWVVVNGTALVTRDGEQMLLSENESIYLPVGAVHRLENPGRIPLNLIEVQSGGYLEEDDIVRIEDVYGRVPQF
jgi:mannose-6-phosphate isomerase-like protein (cupin superfamily)